MSRSLTVGGLPGTGTTTLCKLLRDELGLDYTYAGSIFREAAAERGMDLAAFGALCEEDSSVDQALDNKQIALLHEGDLILEGRLAGWHAHRNQLPALKIWVNCDEPERVRRLVERDGGDERSQRIGARKREASEAARYRRYYGIDLSDTSIYDLLLDSTMTRPNELAERVLEAWNA